MGQKEKMIEAIVKEIQLTTTFQENANHSSAESKLENIDRRNKTKVISTLYFGGGTPSLLSIEELELIFDALPEEMDKLKPIILDNMRAALPLPNGVPVEAEMGVGENWLLAH